jgi:hypothetical protein
MMDNEKITDSFVVPRAAVVLMACRGNQKRHGVIFIPRTRDTKARELDIYMPFRQSGPKLHTAEVPRSFRERLLWMRLMLQADEDRDKTELQRLKKQGLSDGFCTRDDLKDIPRLLATMFNVGMYHARPDSGLGAQIVLWRNDETKKLRLGILCPDLRTAWFTEALHSVGRTSGARLCIVCGKELEGRQKNYCGPRHKARALMRKMRSAN